MLSYWWTAYASRLFFGSRNKSAISACCAGFTLGNKASIPMAATMSDQQREEFLLAFMKDLMSRNEEGRYERQEDVRESVITLNASEFSLHTVYCAARLRGTLRLKTYCESKNMISWKIREDITRKRFFGVFWGAKPINSRGNYRIDKEGQRYSYTKAVISFK